MTSPTTPAPAPERDWTVQATETVESVVLSVKARTTVLFTVADAIVFGLVITVFAIVLLTVSVIAFIRISAVYLLGWAGRVDGQVRLWIAYVVLGMVFSVSGFILWSLRRPRTR